MRKICLMLVLFVVINGCGSAEKRAAKPQDQVVTLAREVIEIKKEKQAKERIEELIGFLNLEDKRPQQEMAYMTSIKEKISTEILGQLRASGVFKEIHQPLQDSDIIVITGSINKFVWESAETMLSYIPVLNVLTIFGLPSQRVYGNVDISLEFRNNKTGQIIRSFRESHATQKRYNIYSFKPDKEDKELAESFTKVINKLIANIRKNKNEILTAVDKTLEETEAGIMP